VLVFVNFSLFIFSRDKGENESGGGEKKKSNNKSELKGLFSSEIFGSDSFSSQTSSYGSSMVTSLIDPNDPFSTLVSNKELYETIINGSDCLIFLLLFNIDCYFN